MSDDPIKKRLARAKQKAAEDLADLGYDVLMSDNNPVCLIAYRAGDIRVIRVCLDEVSVTDEKSLKRLSASTIVSREFWTRMPGASRFRITKL